MGIAGVSSALGSWRSAGKGPGGAQIDLLIDRRDGVVNVCEMKFSAGEFAITADYAKKLRNKIAVFKEEAAGRRSVHLTFVTAHGLKRNEYSGMVQSQVVLDDLFER